MSGGKNTARAKKLELCLVRAALGEVVPIAAKFKVHVDRNRVIRA